MGLLRGYGNAIVPEVAAAWIEAVMDTERARRLKESTAGPVRKGSGR
jgi:hypothetical protein